VIARKVSFRSSPDADSQARSVLMFVLHTLNKRKEDQSLESIFKSLLDELPKNPKAQMVSLLPSHIYPVSEALLTKIFLLDRFSYMWYTAYCMLHAVYFQSVN
jgi:hypothetical protein